MFISENDYRKAFQAYIRKGIPIERSLKQGRLTTHYVWRTRSDGKVRDSHRANDGKIFSWDSPPATGHPGEDFGCRCVAEPYYAKETETLSHELRHTRDHAARWENFDFISHFHLGGGRNVTLAEIGHLSEVTKHWAIRHGALQRWSTQIISRARLVGSGRLSASFSNSYGFERVEFSHGDSVVSGDFEGLVIKNGSMLKISGRTTYRFSDAFTDPIDLREFSAWLRERPDRARRLIQSVGALVGLSDGPQGNPLHLNPDEVSRLFGIISDLFGSRYEVQGHWESEFEASVFADRKLSRY